MHILIVSPVTLVTSVHIPLAQLKLVRHLNRQSRGDPSQYALAAKPRQSASESHPLSVDLKQTEVD